jgi:hypothetical protein
MMATVTSDERDRLWAEAAIREELKKVGRCAGDNAHRPDSEFWKCIIRIASVVKGSGRAYVSPDAIRAAVIDHAPPSLRVKGNSKEAGITYLWGRAYNKAYPRYRVRSLEESRFP